MKTSRSRQHWKSCTRTNGMSSSLIGRVWIGAGTLFVGLGTLGIFLPLLPTTPFLLLAAACYARGSKRFYNWLAGNRWFGNYIRNYREKKGIPLKIKILSVSFLWATIGYSTFFVIDIPLVRVILVLIAIAVTIHIIRFRTLIQWKINPVHLNRLQKLAMPCAEIWSSELWPSVIAEYHRSGSLYLLRKKF